jgi:peptidoglycan-associated lipoprotein
MRDGRARHRSQEEHMSRSIAALFVMAISLAARSAGAQEATARPGAVEVTYMPAGAAFFTSKDDSSGETDPTPNFGNYTFGTAVTVNLNRVIGIEGEIGSMIATKSGLQFGTLGDDLKAPNMLSYTGNVVVSPWTGHALVPYATGGIGGMTMFERPRLGVLSDETFLTGNVGGGVKWYAANKRWGLRGDYRFAATRGKDDAPEFYGRDTRYAHRVYAGVIIGTGTRRTAPRPPATPATPAPPVAAAPPPPPPVQQQLNVREVEEVEVEETIEFAVLDDVQFDFDQAVPRADALPALQQAVNALRQNLALRLVIEGHASNEGTAEYNLALGERRAWSVKDYIVANGIDASRLQTISFGEERPKYDNSTEETRRLNRRAAFVPADQNSSDQGQ